MAAIISAVGPLAPRCSGNENLVNISWGDNIMVGSGISKLDTPEKIRISMRSWLDPYDGKTILWRRFNRDDWAIEQYKRPWREMLPENERLTVNGRTYIHWYDCITDYIL